MPRAILGASVAHKDPTSARRVCPFQAKSLPLHSGYSEGLSTVSIGLDFIYGIYAVYPSCPVAEQFDRDDRLRSKRHHIAGPNGVSVPALTKGNGCSSAHAIEDKSAFCVLVDTCQISLKFGSFDINDWQEKKYQNTDRKRLHWGHALRNRVIARAAMWPNELSLFLPEPASASQRNSERYRSFSALDCRSEA